MVVSVDGGADEAVRLMVNVDRKSVGWWRDREAKARVSALFGKSSMRVGLATPASGLISATFDVSGLETQIAPLRAACAW
jgi:hypothetical protein